MYTTITDDNILVTETISTPRVYITFSNDKLPVWTPLLKCYLTAKQGFPIAYTHTLVIVYYPLIKELVMYELDFFQGGASIYVADAVVVSHDRINHQLLIEQDGLDDVVLPAADITTRVIVDGFDSRWGIIEQFGNISPWSLAKHLIPGYTHKTFTCTGATTYLTGLAELNDSMNNPLTPDELYKLVTE